MDSLAEVDILVVGNILVVEDILVVGDKQPAGLVVGNTLAIQAEEYSHTYYMYYCIQNLMFVAACWPCGG